MRSQGRGEARTSDRKCTETIPRMCMNVSKKGSQGCTNSWNKKTKIGLMLRGGESTIFFLAVLGSGEAGLMNPSWKRPHESGGRGSSFWSRVLEGFCFAATLCGQLVELRARGLEYMAVAMGNCRPPALMNAPLIHGIRYGSNFLSRRLILFSVHWQNPVLLANGRRTVRPRVDEDGVGETVNWKNW